ncbi:MAG: hypothetical protein GC181_14095 [Bacteroidetes bacterium]|nr:hypothetical protein [Bacteroidota bacterium]
MKTLISFIVLFFGVVSTSSAQSFAGYQPINHHTGYITLVWQGKPWLGIGYNYHHFAKAFIDMQGEIRFPLLDMYQFKNMTAVAGAYRPSSVSKNFIGTGLHLRYERTNNGRQNSALKMALTVLPARTLHQSLDDRPYYTAGARFTFVQTLRKVESNSKTSTITTFKGSSVEYGVHFDFMLKRTFGNAINLVQTRMLNTEVRPVTGFRGEYFFGQMF